MLGVAPRSSPAGRSGTSGRVVVAVAVAAVLLLIGARIVVVSQPTARPAPSGARRLVLVGVAGRSQLSPADRTLVERHRAVAQVGAVLVQTRSVGTCAASDWATLGAGRPADVGSFCSIQVQQGQVQHWASILGAAAAHDRDARLGTLSSTRLGCILAVGPGAVLAAAGPDGSVGDFQTVADYLSRGARSPCALTLVDVGDQPDRVVQPLVADLVARPDTEVIVAGIGQPSDRLDADLHVLYRISRGPAGWLTSASTRQRGAVTLTDLTATLIDFGRPSAESAAGLTDGSPLRVVPAPVTADAAAARLRGLRARSGAMVRAADRDVAVVFGVLVLACAAGLLLRRKEIVRAVWSVAVVAPATLSLVGLTWWYGSSTPGLALALALLILSVGLTLLAWAIARRVRVPLAVAGALLTVTVLSVDAVTGGLMQRGSLLNPRPFDGGRWYGFGNVTSAVYAAAALVLVGYLSASRRRPRQSAVSAALLALVILVCGGWPAFGADFGGLLALGPPMGWLLLTTRATARGRPRRREVLAVLLGSAGAAGVAVVVAWLDWSKGPGARSYLGKFVQRVLDADAGGLLLRKATAVLNSLTTSTGLVVLAVGAVVWLIVLIRVQNVAASWWHPRVSRVVLATAILGTLLNDSGVAVFAAVTASYAVTVASLWIDSLEGTDRPLSSGDERDPAALVQAGSRSSSVRSPRS